MSAFNRRIRPAVDHELRAARMADASGRPDDAFRHLERAHVLGQASTRQHVRAHVRMLGWALRHRAPREAWGQLVRIVGAATKTAFGWVPTGNTGGADVSPFTSMPVPADLQVTLDAARQSRTG